MIVDNNFFRFIDRHMKLIVFIILVIIGCFILLYTANNQAKKKNAEQANTMAQSTTADKAIISDTKVNPSTTQSNNDLIKEFMDDCNNGSVESAYALLTDNCKKALYSSVDEFKRDYIDVIFTEQRTYSIQTWITEGGNITYKLAIQGDMLSSGKVNGAAIEEYITIINNDDVKKLSVNSFIDTEEVKLTNKDNDIKISAVTKDIYMDYEVYNFEIQNNTDKSILIDTLEASDSIYLVGKNETQYTAYINELDGEYVHLRPGTKKQVSIKFNKMYNTKTAISSIKFTNIVEDYDDYVAYSDYGHERREIEVKNSYSED